jgi:hypothetical protein
MAAGFREEPRQAEKLPRRLHRSRAQPITDPAAVHGRPGQGESSIRSMA